MNFEMSPMGFMVRCPSGNQAVLRLLQSQNAVAVEVFYRISPNRADETFVETQVQRILGAPSEIASIELRGTAQEQLAQIAFVMAGPGDTTQ